MRLPGSVGQVNAGEILYDASGTITSGSAAQLVLPKAHSRSSLFFQNTSPNDMYLEIGGARATATLTNGVVTSVSVENAGFGYTVAPTVEFLGGAFGNGNQITPTFSGVTGLPDFMAPAAPNGSLAKAHCVMTGAAGAMSISSIVIDNGGKNYLYPPYVYLRNSLNDPFGSAIPSTSSGIVLTPAGSYTVNATICTTDQIAVFCASATSSFTCKFSI